MMGVEVGLWGQRVGVLIQSDQGLGFEYDPEFRKTGLEISPFNLPLNGKKVFLNEAIWRDTNGLPGVVYDSLPDRFGNALLEAYLAERGLTDADVSAFVKLQYIGARGMGALEYLPSRAVDHTDRSITIQELEQLAALGAKKKAALTANLKDADALLQVIHVGTSAGGARAKALIAVHNQTGDIKSGQLEHGEDYQDYLIKMDGANEQSLGEPLGYGRLEYAYYLMARDCGIHMMPSKLYGQSHFMTSRFDRDAQGNKLHMHSLCGLLGLNYHDVGRYSYEQYFMTVRRLGLGHAAQDEVFRRMVFNVLAHNCDDHTKNFAFLMDSEGKWSLSPAFDLCYSYDSSNEWVNGHNMRINNKREGITFDDLMAVGEKFNVKKRSALFQQVKAATDRVSEYLEEQHVLPALIDDVERNRPRLRARD